MNSLDEVDLHYEYNVKELTLQLPLNYIWYSSLLIEYPNYCSSWNRNDNIAFSLEELVY